MKVSDPIIFAWPCGRSSQVFYNAPAGLQGVGRSTRATAWATCTRRFRAPAPTGGDRGGHPDCLRPSGPLWRWSTPTRDTNLHVPDRRDHRRLDPPEIRDSVRCVHRTASSAAEGRRPRPQLCPAHHEALEHCKQHAPSIARHDGQSCRTSGLIGQQAKNTAPTTRRSRCTSAGTVRVVDAQGNTLIEHAL